MPNKSSSSVRRDAVPERVVLEAAREWAARLKRQRPEVRRVGVFGSYIRGDYVPGSDLDVLIEVASAPPARHRLERAADYYPSGFPVSADIFVYTTDELAALRAEHSAFLKAVDETLLWIDDPQGASAEPPGV